MEDIRQVSGYAKLKSVYDLDVKQTTQKNFKLPYIFPNGVRAGI